MPLPRWLAQRRAMHLRLAREAGLDEEIVLLSKRLVARQVAATLAERYPLLVAAWRREGVDIVSLVRTVREDGGVAPLGPLVFGPGGK